LDNGEVFSYAVGCSSLFNSLSNAATIACLPVNMMKFRASFQVPRESRADGTATGNNAKLGSLKHKRSRLWFSETAKEDKDNVAPKETPAIAAVTEDAPPRPTTSRKQAVQDFFKATSSHFRMTGANIKASAANTKLPRRLPVRKSRVAKQTSRTASKRNSQVRSFDIGDDVLDRLVGPSRTKSKGKIQSEHFLVKQRIRASSRAASSMTQVSPLNGTSQAAIDRKPLSKQEVEDMFVGAPYFNVEKLSSGQYRPQIIFRGGDPEDSRLYGTDYRPLSHQTFAASSLGLHRTRESANQSYDVKSNLRIPDDSLLEVPNMLSANGLDPGTVGFEHFLQLPVADSTVMPNEPIFFEKRMLLDTEPEKLGLRKLGTEVLVHRMNELTDLHAAQKSSDQAQQPWSDSKIEEMGEELFGKVVDAELGTTGAGTGDVSLKTQIAALQKVLSESELWHDFSQVEWRIRVGQLLWAAEEAEASPFASDRRPSERDVLLLQMTLASELLVRLDALKRLPVSALTQSERESISKAQSTKMQYDMVLAKTVLEHLTIAVSTGNTSNRTNRNSFLSAISYLTAKETTEEAATDCVQAVFLPKDEKTQLSGLLLFSEALGWPHSADVEAQLKNKLSKNTTVSDIKKQEVVKPSRPVSGISFYATPLSSPILPGYSPSVKRGSYFGELGRQSRPGLSRMTTANSMQLQAASSPTNTGEFSDFEVGGWLSRSWLAGLVLPGEPASHFLLSTLLENSPQAIDSLGESADLYGGFLYRGRTYWSKSCVAGRVLAASKGAKECMGWISVPWPSESEQRDDGWLSLDVKDIPGTESTAARVIESEKVAEESDPLHSSSIFGLQAGEFTKPSDGPPVMGNDVKCHGMTFKTSQPVAKGQDSSSISLVAHLSFSSSSNTKMTKLEIPLTHDVHFVASYPCHPHPRKAVEKSMSKEGSTNSAQTPTATTAASTPTVTELEPPSPLEAPPVIVPGAIPRKRVPRRDSQTDVKRISGMLLSARSSQVALSNAAHPGADAARQSGITLSLADIEKELPPPPAHPLHFEYRYNVLTVASLLSAHPERRPRALSSPGTRKALSEDDETIVLDCRGAEDLELLGRAWCAKVGQNALIGRSGRTCLACCVREARALGMKIVIRT
jgi:hypothetical protein